MSARRSRPQVVDRVFAVDAPERPSGRPSPLHVELAARVLRLLRDQGAGRGCRLIETELCSAFGVSRTPIRGALRLLASQGAIRARPNRGCVLIQAAALALVTDQPGLREQAG